jgi:hypothetical protein
MSPSYNLHIRNNTSQSLSNSRGGLHNLSSKAKKTLAASTRSETALRKWKRVRHYLEWCEDRKLTAANALPAPEWLLCEYAASFAGCVAGGTAQGYISAVRGWHTRKGVVWNGGKNLRDMLRGVERQAPPSSRREERLPVKEEFIEHLHHDLDLSGRNGLHACVVAHAKMLWSGQMRAGEPLPTSPDISKFSPLDHPTVAHLSQRNSKGSRTLKLPKTKVEPIRGETVILSAIPNPITDPNPALEFHIHVNNLALTDPLCAFRNSRGYLSVMTKKLFMDTCNEIWAKHGIPRITGHSFRIGSTTHLLLLGIPPDVVKATGRWRSDSFLKYWRNLESLASLHIHRFHSQQLYASQVNPLYFNR